MTIPSPLINDPIWIIVFDHSIKSDSLKDKASLYVPVPQMPQLPEQPQTLQIPPEVSEENKRMALDFLERMNEAFKEITEAYLTEAEKDESKRPQVKEIRQKFKSLDAWIHWLRHFQKPTSEDPTSEEQ